MTLPGFEDSKLRDACSERCAEYGDPPCYSLVGELHDLAVVDGALKPIAIHPCGECLRDIGIEPGDEFDENAAVGRLL